MTTQIVFSLFGILTIVQWLRVALDAMQFEKKALEFATVKEKAPDDFKISVIIPARNEERHLQTALTTLQKQTFKNFEVILINDRSTDQTGAVMQKFAAQSSSALPWQYVEIKELPEGWLGKNNAMHFGASLAQGEYLLFTDGDIFFAPEALQTAIDVAHSHKLDHLVLTPLFITHSLWLKAMQCFFAMLFVSLIKPGRIGKSKKYYIGAGAFNFVKRSSYLGIGGHEKLRLEIIDDVMLGKVLIESGGKLGYIEGLHLISVEWYATWREMIRGLEKNGFSAFRYSVWRFAGMTISQFLFHFVPYAALFYVGSPAWEMILAGLIIKHILFAVAASRMKFPIFISLMVPIAAWLVYFAHLRSTVLALHRGRISWRDTSYSLEDLKKNML